VFCEHLSISFQVSSKKWRLEINEFVTPILANDSLFFAQGFSVSIIQILRFVHVLFPINDSFIYIERAPF